MTSFPLLDAEDSASESRVTCRVRNSMLMLENIRVQNRYEVLKRFDVAVVCAMTNACCYSV